MKRLSWKLLAGFFRTTRGGAVGISSVMLTLMCFGGTALLTDHVALVHQRNVLQAASASASLATSQALGSLDQTLTDQQVAEALEPLARRYILANLSEGTRELARRTLEIRLRPDMEAGLVKVNAAASLGGAIAGRHLWGALVEKSRAASGAERVVAPVDLVLVMDVTGSMAGSIHNKHLGPISEEDRRITVVRNAAQHLIQALFDQDETHHVWVGLVPFSTTVNIGGERQDWVSDLGQGHKVVPPGFGPWPGCIEHRSMGNDLDLSLVRPDEAPFTAWFWPSTLDYRPEERLAFEEQLNAKVPGENDWTAAGAHEGYKPSPYYGCPRDRIIPLTNEREAIEQAIAKLQPWAAGGTMMHVGVVWGRRLLSSNWRDLWDLADDREQQGKKKVMVVLSDGLNDAWDSAGTYPGKFYRNGKNYSYAHTSDYTGYGRVGNGTIEEGYRPGNRLDGVTSDQEEREVLDLLFERSCDRAKDDGIAVFTVSAVPRGHSMEDALRRALIDCATSEEHAFVEDSEPELMAAAFKEIGRMVTGTRRTNTPDLEPNASPGDRLPDPVDVPDLEPNWKSPESRFGGTE